MGDVTRTAPSASSDTLARMLKWLDSRHGVHIEGVLHAGANAGQEASVYHAWGMKSVQWIEADPVVFGRLVSHLAAYPEQKAVLACISDEDGAAIRFNLASNNGGSSSALMPDDVRCQREWPGVEFAGSVDLRGSRLDSLVASGKLELQHCNLLCLDLQGSELLALNSLGSILTSFEAVCTEVSFQRMYHDAPLLHEVDLFLSRSGFKRARLMLSVCQGEAWYVRREQGNLAILYGLLVNLALEASSWLGLDRAVQSNPRIAAVLRSVWRQLSRRGVV